MNQKLKAILDRDKIMIIDGSMSTALEKMGLNLNDSLWTALALVDHADLVEKVHRNYFEVGAQCSISCSYQATIPGFLSRGYSQKQAEEFIFRSGKILKDVVDDLGGNKSGNELIALGGVGPYGAYLADGSEYTGRYNVSDKELKDFHKKRMELLVQSGVDMLMIETQPSLKEAVIEAELAEDLGVDYCVSFSCKDGKHIHEGELVSDCAKELEQYPHINMIGVNCIPPQNAESLIKELKNATDLPVSVYPNSGECYDSCTKTWCGESSLDGYEDFALSWMKAGASAVGGCCRTTEEHIKAVVRARSVYTQIK